MGKLWFPAGVHWVTVVPVGETIEAASADNVVYWSRTAHKPNVHTVSILRAFTTDYF